MASKWHFIWHLEDATGFINRISCKKDPGFDLTEQRAAAWGFAPY